MMKDSPQLRNRRTVFGDVCKLSRPFKSPLVKTPLPKENSSPSTPTTSTSSELHSSLRGNKRNQQSSIPSPLSAQSVGKSAQPKRLKLSTEMNLEDLHMCEAKLDEDIAQLELEGLSVEELDHQIDLLHRYNDIKDIAQIVMGRLAELEGVTVRSLHQKYGVPISD